MSDYFSHRQHVVFYANYSVGAPSPNYKLLTFRRQVSPVSDVRVRVISGMYLNGLKPSLYGLNIKSIVVNMIATACLMVAGSVMAAEMPALAKKNSCTDCHAIDKKIVGPAWMDVSKKYKGTAEYEYKEKKYPLLEGLVMKVSKGGSGNWGHMPMPINDPTGAKQAEFQELVQFILGLAKE